MLFYKSFLSWLLRFCYTYTNGGGLIRNPTILMKLKLLCLVSIVFLLSGCTASKPIDYETIYYAEHDVTITIYTKETKDSVQVESLVLMMTEESLDFKTETSTNVEELSALKNHYETTILELMSMVGVAFSTSDAFWREPHPDLFLSVMLLPQTFDLNSPNPDGYQLMLHLNFTVKPSDEIKAYLKTKFGIDTEITLDGLDLNAFLANENFKYHNYLNEQYYFSKLERYRKIP